MLNGGATANEQRSKGSYESLGAELDAARSEAAQLREQLLSLTGDHATALEKIKALEEKITTLTEESRKALEREQEIASEKLEREEDGRKAAIRKLKKLRDEMTELKTELTVFKTKESEREGRGKRQLFTRLASLVVASIGAAQLKSVSLASFGAWTAAESMMFGIGTLLVALATVILVANEDPNTTKKSPASK